MIVNKNQNSDFFKFWVEQLEYRNINIFFSDPDH